MQPLSEFENLYEFLTYSNWKVFTIQALEESIEKWESGKIEWHKRRVCDEQPDSRPFLKVSNQAKNIFVLS